MEGRLAHGIVELATGQFVPFLEMRGKALLRTDIGFRRGGIAVPADQDQVVGPGDHPESIVGKPFVADLEFVGELALADVDSHGDI